MKRKLRLRNPNFLSNLLIVLIGILFYVVLTHLGAVHTHLISIKKVLMPFIIGFAIAYLLNGPASFFERRVYKKLMGKRGLSILSVYLPVIIIIVALLYVVVPSVIDSVTSLISNLPVYLNNLTTWVDNIAANLGVEWDVLNSLLGSYEDLWSSLASAISTQLPELINYGISIGKAVISGITAVIASVYMLNGKKKLRHQITGLLYGLFPKKGVVKFLHICRRANRIFIGFIYGKLIDSAIIGILCAIFCVILRIPLVPLISVIIGVTNIIPFYGPFIGAIPSVLIILMINPWAALRLAILVLVLQQVDGNLLGPKILGNTTGLSPIWVLVAIVVGGGLFGVVGMILGCPVFAVIYMLLRDYISTRLKKKNLDIYGHTLHPEEAGDSASPPESADAADPGDPADSDNFEDE